MKTDLYSLTPAMMKIADNPTDPWLDDYLKSEGLVPYKFGEVRAKKSAKVDTSDVVAPPPSVKKTVTETGHSQSLLDHLASKVKE